MDDDENGKGIVMSGDDDDGVDETANDEEFEDHVCPGAWKDPVSTGNSESG